MADNFIWNNETHTYEVANKSIVDIAKHNLDEKGKLDFVIANEDDLKRAKKQRTEINNAVKEVSTARKQMTAVVLAQFAPVCKEIEAYGTQISAEITKKIKEFEGEVEKKSYTLTIKTENISALKKIETLASKYGLQAVIKEN